MSETSIIMLTYNRLELTKQTLNSLFDTLSFTPYNLIIVDNGSTDGTREYLNNLKGNFNKLITVLNNRNYGISIGRNIGLLEANKLNSQYYVTIDNDILFPKSGYKEDWLAECISLLKANRTYGMTGINYEDNKYPLITKNGHTFQHKNIGNLGSACTVYGKSLHKMLGFYEYRGYGRYSFDDSDFGMRVRVAGFKLCYINDSNDEAKHLGVGDNDTGEYRQKKDADFKKYLDNFNKNCAMYVKKQKPIYVKFSERDIK